MAAGNDRSVGHPLFARFFDRFAAKDEERGQAELRRELLDGLSGRVVEVGAGNGLNFPHYPASVDEVVAVEPEAYLRERAEGAARTAPVPIQVTGGLAGALPLEDTSFDAAVVSGVLCSVPDQEAALADLRRVLRPGGELRFYEHVRARGSFRARSQDAADLVWPRLMGGCHPNRDTLAAIERAGFRVERCRGFRFPPSARISPSLRRGSGSRSWPSSSPRGDRRRLDACRCAGAAARTEPGHRAVLSRVRRAAPAGPAREARKTVTVLFADVTGSTALGERLDPESLRALMRRYFDDLAAILERHGGTVEKFIGDAIMAVFGVPVVHEDDALRAVRAAAEMRAALGDAQRRARGALGVALALRTGVNTGEVVAGDGGGQARHRRRRQRRRAPGAGRRPGRDPDRRADAAARPRRGRGRAASSRSSSRARPSPSPRTACSRSRPGAPGVARRLDSPLVGREHELRAAARRVRAGARASAAASSSPCSAPPGVGKSRLVAEFVARRRRPRRRSSRGRCLPYGEGITYWPVAEVVRAGRRDRRGRRAATQCAEARALVGGRGGRARSLHRIAGCGGARLGGAGAPARRSSGRCAGCSRRSPRERPLVRRLRRRPLGRADVPRPRRAPRRLIARRADPGALHGAARAARARPGLGRRQAQRDDSPARAADARRRRARWSRTCSAAAALDDAMRGRIVAAAEGNPLFVEELLAMLVEDGLLERETAVAARGDCRRPDAADDPGAARRPPRPAGAASAP